MGGSRPVLRGKCRAMHAYIRKEKRSAIDNLSFWIKKLKQEEQFKPKQVEENNRISKGITENENRKIIGKKQRNQKLVL